MEILEIIGKAIVKAIKMFALYTRTIKPDKISLILDEQTSDIQITNHEVKDANLVTITAMHGNNNVGEWQITALPIGETIKLNARQLVDKDVITIYLDGHVEPVEDNTVIVFTLKWRKHLHWCKCTKMLQLD